MSLVEASAQGTSAKCAETTSVILEGTPHETQDRLQNSLPLTPRLPIEGKPSGCKQEAVDSIVTTGRTNGMVRMAEPTEIADVNLEKAAPDGEPAERAHRINEGNETVADVDRMALLGREPAEMACRVDEGDGTEHGYQVRLQQTGFYCEETRQRNENANTNVPIAYGVPLEGEWTGYASGEMRDPEGDANASDAATERADCPCESRETADANGVELEGRREGMSGSASVDKVDGNASRGTGPADTSNELMEFVAVSIEPEDLGSGGIPHVCLGDRADGSEGLTDVLRGLADGSRESTDPSHESKRAETAMLGCGDGPSTYLGPGDETETAVNETESVRKCRNSWTT